MKILVIDAQGGGLGRMLVENIKKGIPDAYVYAVGTNSVATSAMLKAGADEAATGENSVLAALRKAEVVVGPVGIVIADSMLGEITPRIALAISRAEVRRVLIPFNHCDSYIVGTDKKGMSAVVQEAVELIRTFCEKDS